jgi:hypothetical protein
MIADSDFLGVSMALTLIERRTPSLVEQVWAFRKPIAAVDPRLNADPPLGG